jgi:hypothetical protein
MLYSLEGQGIPAMVYPPYSPGLASADLWLFPELRSVQKGKCLLDVEDIELCVKNIFRFSCSGLKKWFSNG